eukprot:CAMPEP_0119412376 /NCGR_PEP_ID=MMETSP1335-20130426/4848_1 /TAXON_ID=259385 /ORGANISM="Chrysoculter rhomboideus, Strain RCC1486" /LENGTH=155 /DNA_ID=CAMNT_0007437109 /DNA_START=114 /DNA_END=577 /DNA_ORIENTATION=-
MTEFCRRAQAALGAGAIAPTPSFGGVVPVQLIERWQPRKEGMLDDDPDPAVTGTQPALGIACEQRADHVLRDGREARREQVAECIRVELHDAAHHLSGGVRPERRLAREHLVQRAPQRPAVRAHARVRADDQLGCEVGSCALETSVCIGALAASD